MTERKLDDHLRDHYQAEELPAASLDRLRQRIAAEQTAVPSRWRSWPRWLAIAATVLVALSAGLFVSRPWHPQGEIRDIAREAARDHNLRLAVEFQVDDYAHVRARMTNLQFSPIEPDSLKGMSMRLLGTRYSSLQGQPALELKLEDGRGEICTLIQARPVDRLATVHQRTQHHIDGLRVDVWREKGLVMVLARPIP
jgi:hypothetical protein